MTRQPYRRRTLSTDLRDENAPVGSIKPNGFGANQLGAHITALVKDETVLVPDETALMVFMDSNGDVYALDPNGIRATATANVHPDWIVGTYTSRCGAGTIAGDLRVQARELGRMAA